MPYNIWLLNFVSAQGYEIRDNVPYQDNQSTILMLKIAEIPAQVTRGMYILYTFSLKIGLTNNQMGGVVIQSGKTLVFFSRKFNSTQSKYTNTEQELLAVTETLKQF